LTLTGQKSGLFQGAGTTTWSQVAGPAVIINSPNSLTTTVTGHSGGNSYTFRISTTCADGSFVYQDVVVNVNSITTATASGGFTSCPGTNVGTLTGNTPGSGETGTWVEITDNGGITVNNPSSPTSTVNLSSGYCGTSTLRWTISNPNGCSSSSSVISVVNRGGVTPVSAGTDQVLSHCYSTTQWTDLYGTNGGCGIDGQSGVWTIISGPNVPSFSNASSSTPRVTNLIQGTYVFRWTVSGPCVSGYDEVTVTVPGPTANITNAYAGANQQFCDARTTTVLSGNAPLYINETITWSQIGGPTSTTIVSPNLPVTQITGLNGTGTYTYQYTINNAVTNCTSIDYVTVSYFTNIPVVTITQKPILLTCGNTVASIPYTSSGPGVTQYRIISGPSGGLPTSWSNVSASPALVYGFSAEGTYVVQFRQYTTTDVLCGSEYDEVNVIVSASPVLANAGTPQTLACNTAYTTLAGNDPGGFIGIWSQVSGPSSVILTDPNEHNLFIQNLSPGLYTFRWTIYGGPTCPQNSDETTVLVASAIPTAHTAGTDQTVCSGSPFQLSADPPHYSFEYGVWSVSPSAGISFSDLNDPHAIVTGLQNNTVYTFTWTIVNGCGSNFDDVVITVNNNVGAVASNAGPDQCLNSGVTSTTLAGNNPPSGTGTWSLKSGPNTPTFTNANLYNTTVTNLINGTYVFNWTISAGVGCTPTVDSVMITIGGVTTAAAPEDVILCGNVTTVTANAAGSGETGTWIQVMGPAGPVIQSPNSNSTQITNLVNGTYSFSWTITNGSCISSDTVTISASEPPIAVEAGDSIGVCGTSSTQLNATPVTGGVWTLISGPNFPTFSSLTAANATVTNLVMGQYKFKWSNTSSDYCPSTWDSVVVDVVPAAYAGTDQSYCDTITYVNLAGNLSSIGTWSWVTDDTLAVPTIITTSQNTAVASGLSTGTDNMVTYTFRYTITSGSCSTSDDVNVTFYAPPSIAAAGADQYLCDQTTFNLAATDPDFGTGTWSLLFGPGGGSFTDANDPTTTFTGAVPGVYVFQWTIANGSCNNADQVRIENYDSPSPAVAGPDISSVCDTIATMAATDPAVGVGQWTLISKLGNGPTPVITSPILYNTTITHLGPQTSGADEVYTFEWSVTNGPACPTYRDTMTITVHQVPTVATAGSDQNLCNVFTTVLQGNTPSPGIGEWTVISSPSGATPPVFSLTNANTPTATVTFDNTKYGTYQLRWTTHTTYCYSSDDVNITIYQEPSTPQDVANFAICQFDNMNLSTTAPTVGTGVWSQVSGPNTANILNPTSNSTQVIGFITGTYVFRYTISNGTCTPKTDEVTVTVNPIPTQAIVGADQFLCNATSATLTGNNPSIGTGTWTVQSGQVGVTFYQMPTPIMQ
jgi:hypothetical protein